MRPAKNTPRIERVHLRWSEAMVSVPDEATAYAMKAIQNLKFNYVHMLILLGYGARSRRSPAPTGQREMGKGR
jgi:hypothetical protein